MVPLEQLTVHAIPFVPAIIAMGTDALPFNVGALVRVSVVPPNGMIVSAALDVYESVVMVRLVWVEIVAAAAAFKVPIVELPVITRALLKRAPLILTVPYVSDAPALNVCPVVPAERVPEKSIVSDPPVYVRFVTVLQFHVVPWLVEDRV